MQVNLENGSIGPSEFETESCLTAVPRRYNHTWAVPSVSGLKRNWIGLG